MIRVIEISIPDGHYKLLMQTLQALAPQEVYKASASAAQRAMVAARTAGQRKIRGIYTIKAGDLKSRVTIRRTEGGSKMRIRGPMEGVQKYRAAAKKSGVFVMIKKGERTRIPRAFMLRDSFLRRETRARYPIKGLYGPAVPQLFGNPEVLEVMETRGQEVFASRLEHEISRRLGV